MLILWYWLCNTKNMIQRTTRWFLYNVSFLRPVIVQVHHLKSSWQLTTMLIHSSICFKSILLCFYITMKAFWKAMSKFMTCKNYLQGFHHFINLDLHSTTFKSLRNVVWYQHGFKYQHIGQYLPEILPRTTSWPNSWANQLKLPQMEPRSTFVLLGICQCWVVLHLSVSA